MTVSKMNEEREQLLLPVAQQRPRQESWLLLPKALYFTLNMALYSTLTFTSAYFYEQLGVQIYQFGFVTALSAVELVGAVWWGGWADASSKHRLILLMCTGLYAGSFSALPLIGWLAELWPGCAWLRLPGSMVLVGGSYFCMSAFFPLVDGCVFGMLKAQGTAEKFGRQRLWGTVGHAVVTLLAAQAISRWGWSGMFATMAGSCAAFALTVAVTLGADAALPGAENGEGDTEDGCSVSGLQLLGFGGRAKALWRGDFVLFLGVVLVAGYMRALLSTFLPYYLLIDLGRSPVFFALTAVFRIASEVLIFVWLTFSSDGRGTGIPASRKDDCSETASDVHVHAQPLVRLHQRPREFGMLLVGLGAGVARVAGYSQVGRLQPQLAGWAFAGLICGLEMMKGVSVGMVVSGAVRLAHELAPSAAHTATAQALVSGVYSGLSTAASGLVGGALIWAMPNQRIDYMFGATAVVGAVLLAVFCYAKAAMAVPCE